MVSAVNSIPWIPFLIQYNVCLLLGKFSSLIFMVTINIFGISSSILSDHFHKSHFLYVMSHYFVIERGAFAFLYLVYLIPFYSMINLEIYTPWVHITFCPMSEKGLQRLPFNSGLCPLSLANLKTGMRCYINRAKIKLKETNWEKTMLMSTLGKEWAWAFPRPGMVQAGGNEKGAVYKPCPGLHWQKVPRQPRLRRETIATKWRRWLALWREGQLAPEGCFRGAHKSPFQETGHFEHLPSPASNRGRPQGTNHEWSYLLP